MYVLMRGKHFLKTNKENIIFYDDDGYLLGTYVGEWKNNDWNGWGIWIWSDGTIEKGTYKDGELIK